MTSQHRSCAAPSMSAAGSVATRGSSSDYVTFYLAGMWTWTEAGVRRVTEVLKASNAVSQDGISLVSNLHETPKAASLDFPCTMLCSFR